MPALTDKEDGTHALSGLCIRHLYSELCVYIVMYTYVMRVNFNTWRVRSPRFMEGTAYNYAALLIISAKSCEINKWMLPLLAMSSHVLHLTYCTQSLYTVREKAVLDRSFASLQFYPLKPQLRVLLFLILAGILLTVMLSLAVSSRLSALLFQFDILPFRGKSIQKVNLIPGMALLLAVVVGVIPYATFLILLVVEWTITALKIK